MIAILFFVAVFATADAQTCNVLISREVVRGDRNEIVPAASDSDPVIFTCTVLTSDGRGYAAATAYIAGFLLDYRCKVPDGWELSEGLEQVSVVYAKDVQDGVCSNCVRKPSGEPDGHCQRCTSGCATCGIGGCITCSAGYSLSNTTCIDCPHSQPNIPTGETCPSSGSIKSGSVQAMLACVAVLVGVTVL